MKVLVNYNKTEKGHLAALAYVLQSRGINAVSTAADLSIGELLSKAQSTNCQAILLCNEQTLASCVPGENATLDAWRGSRLNMSVPILIINKLAHLHSVDHGEWLLRKDLDKLKYIGVKPQPFRFTVLRNTDMFAEALHDMSLAHGMAHDIETNTGKITDKQWAELSPNGEPVEVKPTYITCAAWTLLMPSGILKTYVLPLVNFDGDYWTDDKEYGKALRFMQKANALLNWKVMHNGMYDATHLITYHAEPCNYVLDTMVMAHSEFSELPKDLSFVASYTLYDYIQWKDDAESASKTKDQEKYWGYNGKDTWHTMLSLIHI